jgi:hypothetical protein
MAGSGDFIVKRKPTVLLGVQKSFSYGKKVIEEYIRNQL